MVLLQHKSYAHPGVIVLATLNVSERSWLSKSDIKDIFWFTPRSYFVSNAQLVTCTKTGWTPLVAFLSLSLSVN